MARGLRDRFTTALFAARSRGIAHNKAHAGSTMRKDEGGGRFCRGWVKSRMLEDELEARLAAETSRSVLKKRRPGGEGGEVVHTYGVFRRTPRR